MTIEKRVRVAFDEFHSETWTVSAEFAAVMQPDDPSNSSYARAARLLTDREFDVSRRSEGPLTSEYLKSVDVLAIVHPCAPRWEATTGLGTPRFSDDEIVAVESFVRSGGGLLIVGEHEIEKYECNLNDMLKASGLSFLNKTVSDTVACRSEAAPTHVLCRPSGANAMIGVGQACFYRADALSLGDRGNAFVSSSSTSRPAAAVMVAEAPHGLGRVVAVTDSDLFGDEFIGDYDHAQLWLNIFYRLAEPAFSKRASSGTRTDLPTQWHELKTSVEALRPLQDPAPSKTGAVSDLGAHESARAQVQRMMAAIEGLRMDFPHQGPYFDAVVSDLEMWAGDPAADPDFSRSLAEFHPEVDRTEGARHLALFPMYTPNGASEDRRYEAMVFEVPWHSWLDEIEREKFSNPKFVPGVLVDYTSGYDSECAVLFPETIVLPKDTETNNFGVIFCDREAKRYQRVVSACVHDLNLNVPPDFTCFIANLPLVIDAYALWDLIHDTNHSRGPLPFDPFMIRKRKPFWVYGLEELRVDLASYIAASELIGEGFPFARYVQYAILFDRILRFPVTGARVRNYDSVGGQVMFGSLYDQEAVEWNSNRLVVHWDRLDNAVSALHKELLSLYKREVSGAGEIAAWDAYYDLVSKYVSPIPSSKWKAAVQNHDPSAGNKGIIAAVNDDEFPLSAFHRSLRNRLKKEGVL